MRRRCSLRAMLGDNRGTAAVEFALIFALFLLPLFLGLVEVITLYRAQEKLNAFVNDVAFMISIETPGTANNGVYSLPLTAVSATSLTDICNGALAGFAPYPTNSIAVEIASVTEEAGPNGLPTTNSATSFVYNSSSLYDEWEQDFTVSGGSCTASGGTGIGASGTSNNAINLLSSNPPSTAGGSGGVVQYPCDNGIIVKATMNYPGMIGLIISHAITLSQSTYMRWLYASTTTELQCPTCSVSNNNATVIYGTVKQACNASNTGATN